MYGVFRGLISKGLPLIESQMQRLSVGSKVPTRSMVSGIFLSQQDRLGVQRAIAYTVRASTRFREHAGRDPKIGALACGVGLALSSFSTSAVHCEKADSSLIISQEMLEKRVQGLKGLLDDPNTTLANLMQFFWGEDPFNEMGAICHLIENDTYRANLVAKSVESPYNLLFRALNVISVSLVYAVDDHLKVNLAKDLVTALLKKIDSLESGYVIYFECIWTILRGIPFSNKSMRDPLTSILKKHELGPRLLNTWEAYSKDPYVTLFPKSLLEQPKAF